jgi:hypothetical protein
MADNYSSNNGDDWQEKYPVPGGAASQAAPGPAGIRRLPSGPFKRAPSGGSVTFEVAASGQQAAGVFSRLPSNASASSRRSGVKGAFLRVASTITRVVSKGGGIARGGSGEIPMEHDCNAKCANFFKV